jgi:hypothetical protein
MACPSVDVRGFSYIDLTNENVRVHFPTTRLSPVIGYGVLARDARQPPTLLFMLRSNAATPISRPAMIGIAIRSRSANRYF